MKQRTNTATAYQTRTLRRAAIQKEARVTFMRTSITAAIISAVLLAAIHASAQQTQAAPGDTAAITEEGAAPAPLTNAQPAAPAKSSVGVEIARNMVPIVGSIMVFGTIIAVVAIPLLIGYRKTRLQHETVRAMVKEGQPIPVELLRPQTLPKSDLRRGVILLMTGVGLAAFLVLFEGTAREGGLWAVGFIPGLIGIGHLVVWKLETARGIRNNDEA